MKRGVRFTALVLGMFAVGGIGHAAPPVPAGIGRYSYVEIRGIDWGSSDYFGSSARGDGIKLSYRWGGPAFVTGEFNHLEFDSSRLYGYYSQAGINMGLEGTAGKVSAYLRAGFYRVVVSGTLNGARSYYWEIAYGNRIALNRWFELEGEIYSDVHPEFGSRPYGVKLGAGIALGPASLHLLLNHNPDVNSLEAALRFAF